ncbi:MAG TPA: ornithine cyclodeaminase family protein, partial [Candidatus Xenobia bacterium]
MQDNRLLYLTDADVRAVGLDVKTILERLETAFQAHGRREAEMPPKPGIHTKGDAFIHAMPAWIPSLRAAGVKWVSGYPDNPSRGLPYISGVLILNDPDTGLPYAIMDCSWITAWRTGVATALSARYLARPESSVVGILACGVQGRTNLEALAAIFPLQKVFVYDVRPEVRHAYAQAMSERLRLDVIEVDTPRPAVVESDIVVTSGPILKHPQPTIDADWLRPGAFASAVDFDSYWTGSALRQMDLIATD